MIAFEDWLYKLTIPAPPGYNSTEGELPPVITFYEMCYKKPITSAGSEASWANKCTFNKRYCVVPAAPKCETS